MYTISLNKYILIFFIITFGYSQDKIVVPEFKKSFLDNNKSVLTLYSENNKVEIDLNNLSVSDSAFSFPSIKNVEHITKFKNRLLFFENGSGSVFEEKNSTIQKIDNSNINQYLIDSGFFEYNDTIFRHGGYGYWSVFNKLIYFDLSTFEWEYYSKPSFKGRFDHNVFVENEKVYLVGGFMLDDSFKKQERQLNESIVMINMKNNQTEVLGNSSTRIHGVKVENDVGQNIILDDKQQIKILNFKKNSIETFFSNSLNSKILRDYKTYIHKDYFYYFSSTNSKLFLNKFPLDVFITNNRGEETKLIIKKRNQIYFVIFIVITLGISLVLFKKQLRRQIIRYNQKFIFYKDKKEKINSTQYNILKLIEINSVETKLIDEIIFDGSLSRASNYKKKNQIVTDLEKTLKRVTNSDKQIIVIKKSVKDSRIKIYSLNENYNLKKV